MKKLKKLSTAMVLSLTLAMSMPMAMPAYHTIIAEAASIQINKKAVSLEPGKTIQLNLTGTKAKTTWTSSEKTVAVVDQNGKVSAKKAGKATITGKANNKKYTCTVTVGSTSTVKTPYKSKKTTYKGYQFVVPSSWKSETDKSVGTINYIPSNEKYDSSDTGVVLLVESTGVKANYSFLKDAYTELFSEQYNLNKKDIKITELKNKLGTAMKMEAVIEESGIKCNLVSYVISTEDDLIQILALDADKKANPSAKEVGNYMYKSIVKQK